MNAKSVVMLSGFLFLGSLKSADALLPFTGEQPGSHQSVHALPPEEGAPRPQTLEDAIAAIEAHDMQIAALSALLESLRRESRSCNVECLEQAKRCAAATTTPLSVPLACFYGCLGGAARGCYEVNHMYYSGVKRRGGSSCKMTCQVCCCCSLWSCVGGCAGAAQEAANMPRKVIAYACNRRVERVACVTGDSLEFCLGKSDPKPEKDCCRIFFCDDVQDDDGELR